MKTKKILSIALAILMLIGTFAVGASAAEQELKDTDIILAGEIVSGLEESYWLTVDGALTADGASANNYNVAIAPANAAYPTRVILNNAQISKVSTFNEAYYAIVSSGDLDIMLQGKNKVEILPEEYAQICGVYSEGNLRIFGNGELTMNLGNKNTMYVLGICGDVVDITGSTVTTLNLSSFYKIDGGYSLYETTVTDNANLVINENFLRNEEAETQEGYEESELAQGVVAKGYEVTYNGFVLSDNAKVTVNMINTDSVANTNQGLDIEDNLEVSVNSHLTVNGTDGKASAGVVMNNGDLTVNGSSTINAKAGNADEGVSYGVHLYNGNSEKQTIKISDSAKITATAGNAVTESFGFFAYADITATDNAYISATAGNTEESGSESIGAYFSRGLTFSDEAKLIAKAGNSTRESHGVYSKSFILSDDSAVEGYADISERSIGIGGEAVEISGNAKLNGESKGSTEEETAGIFVEALKAYGNAEINAKGGDGIGSCGLYTGQAVIYGSAKINAEAGKAQGRSIGFCSDDTGLIISENASLTAVSKEANISNGIYSHYEMKVSGNAVVDAKAVNGTTQCIGIFANNYFLSTGNANVKAIGSTDAEYSVGLAAIKLDIQNASTVEASGYMAALYSAEEDYKITGYENGYIVAGTDTNPENAVEFTNEHPLVLTGTDEERTEDGYYKYVFIAPEAPEEPEPELSFFEQLIADIVSFFNKIIDFFSSFFSFGG